ncbi:MAG: excinuclease ABC subunit UvrB [Candidatus Nealsonbacteria bacterium]|nr:excinuclease ABC subunit UvrB [Candidatus Nealsonbacteria bacterium]
MGIFKLKAGYKPSGDQPQAIKKLITGLKKGNRFQTLLGVTGSGKTFTVANIIEHFNMPVLVMAPNKSLAAQLYREYKNFFPKNSVNYFVSYYDYYQPEAYMPITDTYIEKEAMINQEIDRLRHKATSALLTRKDVIIVASVSCIYNLGLPESYFKSSLHLEKEKPITRGDLIRQLVKIQFKRTNMNIKRGEFRVRGDVFEIMPASANITYRIELKDQKIFGIYLTDILTKKIIGEEKEAIIFPPKHFVSTRPIIEKAIKEIKKELKERLEYFETNKLYLEAERLRRRTMYDVEMIDSIGYCHGVENYSRHLTGKLAGEAAETLLSYFPFNKKGEPEFLTIIDESHISVPQISGMYQGDKARKQALVQYGWRLPSALDNRPLKFSEFEKRIGQVIFTSATPGQYEAKNSSQVAEQIIRPTGLIDPPIEIRPVFDRKKNKSQIDDLMEELKDISLKGERAIVNTLTKKMAEDLNAYLIKKNFKVNYIHSDVKTLERAEILTDFRRGKFNVLVGVNLLREGLDLPEVTLVAILDADREGFLRNETSLIQTMGRTARNVKGKVILYADTITGSIKRAKSEVERRRKKQMEYNKKHKITPKTISKGIESLLGLEND